jgi:hypothetical protein
MLPSKEPARSSSGPGVSILSRFPALPTLVLILVGTVCVYWMTCYRSITWWGSAEYSVAACTLGVSFPPGSLLLTVLGWIVTRLPLGLSPALLLNLFTGSLAGLALALAGLTAWRLLRTSTPLARPIEGRSVLIPATVGGVLGALSIAYGQTIWQQALRFSPYILTLVITSLIVWSALRWWEEVKGSNGLRWLFVIALLIGLDFSIHHRTNSLLVPGLAFWVLVRHPRAFGSIKVWLYSLGGLALGLAASLAVFPMAFRDPFVNAGNVVTWSAFWDHIRLAQSGGGFLVQFFPRNAPLLDYQTMDFLRAFQNTFFACDGPFGYAGAIPAALGITGLFILLRRDWRLAVGLLGLLVITSATTVLYFNIPENFFRELHRHYMPCMIIATVFVIYGAAALSLWAWHLRENLRWFAVSTVGLLLIIGPVSQMARNYQSLDGSGDYTTIDLAHNMLTGLPPNAVLFVAGDNDTFPIWYVQGVEGFRPDITVLNIPLLNTDWYVEQVLRRDKTFPLPFAAGNLPETRMQPWPDTTAVSLAVRGDTASLGLPEGTPVPDSVVISVASSYGSGQLLPADWTILQFLRMNEFHRPVYVSLTCSPSVLSSLEPYLRLEGYSRRVLPVENHLPDTAVLRRNLLDLYAYRSWNDPEVVLPDVSRNMASILYSVSLQLVMAEKANGNDADAKRILDRMLELMPMDRVNPPDNLRQVIDQLRQT